MYACCILMDVFYYVYLDSGNRLDGSDQLPGFTSAKVRLDQLCFSRLFTFRKDLEVNPTAPQDTLTHEG